MSFSFHRILAVLSAVVLAGCGQLVPSHRHGDLATLEILALADLPAEPKPATPRMLDPRGPLTTRVPPTSTTPKQDAAAALAPADGYWRLKETECAERAAENAPIADLVELERQLVAQSGATSRPNAGKAQLLRQTLLKLRVSDLRNQAASEALQLYYRLVEVEALRDAVRRSVRLVDTALRDVEQLQEQGLSVDTNPHQLTQQRLELIERGQELSRKSEQIDRQLKLLLRATDIAAPIWPDLKLKVTFSPIDAELAVAAGVETRADLTILRLLAATTDQDAMAAARGALRERESSLGVHSPTLRDLIQILPGRTGDSLELHVRRKQLVRLMAAQHRRAASEIRGHTQDIRAHERHIRLSNNRLASRRTHVRQLRQQSRAGAATVFDVFLEQMEVLRVEGELMQQVVAWKIAQVKLRQAQGVAAKGGRMMDWQNDGLAE